jgi:hypothetical protein
VLALISACSAFQNRSETTADAPRKPPAKLTDQLCMSDCLGTGGDSGFCSERCTR